MVHIKINILRSELFVLVLWFSKRTSIKRPFGRLLLTQTRASTGLHKEAKGRRSKTRARISMLVSSTSTDCVLFAVTLRFMGRKAPEWTIFSRSDAPSIYPKLALNSIHMRLIFTACVTLCVPPDLVTSVIVQVQYLRVDLYLL